jgi:hypothetical protein
MSGKPGRSGRQFMSLGPRPKQVRTLTKKEKVAGRRRARAWNHNPKTLARRQERESEADRVAQKREKYYRKNPGARRRRMRHAQARFERFKQISELREQGCSFVEIGRRFGHARNTPREFLLHARQMHERAKEDGREWARSQDSDVVKAISDFMTGDDCSDEAFLKMVDVIGDDLDFELLALDGIYQDGWYGGVILQAQAMMMAVSVGSTVSMTQPRHSKRHVAIHEALLEMQTYDAHRKVHQVE